MYYVGTFPFGDELYHHGIKGQKWGVRNGPPYPIEDKVLAKGTKINHVSRIPNTKEGSEYLRNAGHPLYVFRKDEKYDSAVYKGPFSYGKILQTGQVIYEHQYEVVEDLKMPTSKERIDEFVKQYTDNKKITIKELSDFRKMVMKQMPDNNWSEEAKTINFKKLNTPRDYKAALFESYESKI